MTELQIEEASLNAEYPLQFIEGAKWCRDNDQTLQKLK
jgi:hypothetical protein